MTLTLNQSLLILNLLLELCVEQKLASVDDQCKEQTMPDRLNLYFNKNGENVLGSAFFVLSLNLSLALLQRSSHMHFERMDY